MMVKVKTYPMDELEWVGGRMAHLRVKGEAHTICGADPKSFGEEFVRNHMRRTITAAEAEQKHKCKNCLKRVA